MAEHRAPGLTPSPAAEQAIRRAAGAGSALVIDLPTLSGAMAELAARAGRHGIRLLHTVKASSLPPVLRAARRHGLGFDVSNRAEWETLRDAMPDPGFVSLTPSTLPPAELGWAAGRLRAGGIDRLHLDSLDQLRRFAGQAAPGPVGLRLSMAADAWPPDVPARRVSRFGLPERDDAAAAGLAARAGQEIAWLHLHNASEQNTAVSFTHALSLMLKRAAGLGAAVRQLNLGGGLPKLPAGELDALFADLAAAVPPGTEIVLEPGRWWGRDAVRLVTRVLDVKVGDRCVFVVVDSGAEFRRWSVPSLPVLGPHPDGPGLPYVVCGVSAYEQDFFGQATPVAGAPVPAAGDVLVLGGLSTYSAELATSFNGVHTAIVVAGG